MASKINHVAIMSGNYALESRFYQAMFGMRGSPKARPARAVSIGDGYVGMNINPRRAGRPGRLDHFGIQVDDLQATTARIKEKRPECEVLIRPSTRPFVAFATHDPDGNVFDLAPAKGGNLKDIYTHNDWQADRTISHIGIRTLNAEACAEFYIEMFDLKPANLPIERAYGVTDGRVTLIFLPWSIKDYADTAIVGPGMEYIGFKVEDMDKFKADVLAVGDGNPLLTPAPFGTGPEGEARLELLRRTSLGSWHIADPDGVLLDIVA
ncbi:MAG: VOC family protein [Alphaproteobacteria bacterium]|nr:VOC family protein [Alphaproteobacteria bacterium]